MEKISNSCFSKNKKQRGPCGNIQNDRKFQKKWKNENLVSRSDFCGLCPAWLAKIKKRRKHSSRLASFAKVGEILEFSLTIRLLGLAFWRMIVNENNKVQSNIALTAILEFYTFVLFLGFFLHVLSQCVDSQSAGWIFNLMQNHAHHRAHLTQCPSGPPDWSFPWLLMIFTGLIKLSDVVL